MLAATWQRAKAIVDIEDRDVKLHVVRHLKVNGFRHVDRRGEAFDNTFFRLSSIHNLVPNMRGGNFLVCHKSFTYDGDDRSSVWDRSVGSRSYPLPQVRS